MTKNEMIEKARAEALAKFATWTPAGVAAIEEGLVEGDVISLGGELRAHILAGGIVEMVHDRKTTARLPLAQLTEEQRDRMLILKGIQCGHEGIQIGTVQAVNMR